MSERYVNEKREFSSTKWQIEGFTSELVNLDIEDIDFEERECVVLGKGDKERIVYFDARTKIHLQKYLQARNDPNPALFVSTRSPHHRLKSGGVEMMLKKMGKLTNVNHCHPHKFRRTMVTSAIDKGMPVEQVQMYMEMISSMCIFLFCLCIFKTITRRNIVKLERVFELAKA